MKMFTGTTELHKASDTPINYIPFMVLPPFIDKNKPAHIVIPPIIPFFESVVPYIPLLIVGAAVLALVVAGAIAGVVAGSVRVLIANKERKIERNLRKDYLKGYGLYNDIPYDGRFQRKVLMPLENEKAELLIQNLLQTLGY
ncbi:hypothetical protein QYM36_008081 [Artemia franciscana]|uniref:Uncharacterized protein n=1 Tax=Artemia franciscana TaxID=6661 RepID=A0AA88LED5_ARTSF|nr:hypothetical protein QYM36_008081 [Artemia franciscana]